MFNDFLVWLGFKQRIGILRDVKLIDVSLTEFGLCTQTQVGKVEYKYKWVRPFSKATSAVKKKTPFIKHSNSECGRKHGN